MFILVLGDALKMFALFDTLTWNADFSALIVVLPIVHEVVRNLNPGMESVAFSYVLLWSRHIRFLVLTDFLN